MRCKSCGGLLYHWLTAIGSMRYYRCHQGLTTHDPLYPHRTHGINLCGQVQDQDGKVIPIGTLLAYWSDGKVKTVKVRED